MAKSPFSFIKPEILTELSEQASRLLPSESSKEQIQQNLQTFLQGALSRLDLVSREEFDTQKAVLTKTRQKAEALEKQIQALIEELEQLKK